MTKIKFRAKMAEIKARAEAAQKVVEAALAEERLSRPEKAVLGHRIADLEARMDEEKTRGESEGMAKFSEKTWNMSGEEALVFIHEMGRRAHAWLNAHSVARLGSPSPQEKP